MSRHFSHLLPSVGVLAVLACSATAAFASPIAIQSGDPGAGQSETCANSMNSNTTCVDITPHPVWEPNNPSGSGAVWVSFSDTGVPPDQTFAPPGTTMTYTFTFMAPPNAQFLGHIWSDNDSMIYLDGLFVGGGSATVGGGSTFGAGGGYLISAFLGAGTGGGGGGGCDGCTTHTIVDTVTQGAGADNNSDNPFGVLVSGTTDAVPEPATLALFGMGLLGAGIARRKRKIA